MFKIAMGILIGATLTAGAAEYEQVFLNGNKQVITNEEAIMAAANGSVVYKCNTQEFKVSKSGTSISIKNVKKPKAQ